jgi:peptide/nickel transport system permease protein
VRWFIVRRLGQSLLVLFVVATAVFFLGRVLGDPTTLFVPENATQADIAAMRRSLGLDRPLHEQYLTYLGSLARGDLGRSIRQTGYSVTEVLAPALWSSAQLAAVAMAIAVAGGLPLGILAAVRRDTPLDFLARTVALVGQVVPAWWLGIVMILLFSYTWGLLPAAYSASEGPRQYIMPATIMGLFVMAGLARLTRSSMLEILDSEYVKMARAKGMPRRTVIWKHALRNALIPIVTFGGMYFAILITSALVIEVVFAWPGLGRLMFDSLSRRDFPVMQGAILTGAAIVVAFNFLVDLLYAWIDPRIHYA